MGSQLYLRNYYFFSLMLRPAVFPTFVSLAGQVILFLFPFQHGFKQGAKVLVE